MGLQDRIGNGDREGWIDRPGGSDTVERLLLIEPHHFDRPFDRGTRSVDFKDPVGIARDGNNAAVELWRINGVDLQFLLAGALALLQRRVVEEGQPNGALDLQGPVAAEKYHGGMGVDALAALCRTEAGAIEKIEHALLIDLGRYRFHRSAAVRSWLQHGSAGDLPGAQLRKDFIRLPQRKHARMRPDARLRRDLKELDPVACA